jgi:hypothetical protein
MISSYLYVLGAVIGVQVNLYLICHVDESYKRYG